MVVDNSYDMYCIQYSLIRYKYAYYENDNCVAYM